MLPVISSGIRQSATRRLLTVSQQLRMASVGKSQESTVGTKVSGRIGQTILNRPRALNSLSYEMITKMASILRKMELNQHVAVHLFRGSGGKAFCAGGDVRALVEAGAAGNAKPAQEFFFDEYRLDYQISRLQKPVIALLDGIWMGGGVGITLHNTTGVRIATERTMFAMPETAIGFFPDVGVSHMLSRMPNGLGYYLALTGQALRGRDVLRANLATHLISSKLLDQFETELKDASKTETTAMAVVEKYHQLSAAEDRDLTSSFILQHSEKVAMSFCGSSLEEILANLAKRSSSSWESTQAKVIRSRCPLSLAVAFRQLQENQSKTLEEVFVSDYRLANRFILHPDFHEGVRAALVDKDKNPKWTTHLETVHDEVDRFFSPFATPEEEWTPGDC